MTSKRSARRGLSSPRAGLALLALLGSSALLAPLLARDGALLAREDGRLVLLGGTAGADVLVAAPHPFGPRAIDLDRALDAPSLEHPFGTDALGRDLLARVLHGGRQSFGTGLIATGIAGALALLLGAAAALGPRALDEVIARSADVVHAFPALIGALALLGSLAPASGIAPPLRVGIVLALFAWPGLFRLVRSELSRWTASDVAAAARACGAPRSRVALRHLLPLSLAPVLGPAAFLAGGALLAEAGLGFLGVGIGPPDPSWGGLLREGFAEERSAWWLTAFPGAAVFLAVLGFQLVAEGFGGSPGRRE